MNIKNLADLQQELDELNQDFKIFKSLFPYEQAYVMRRAKEIISEWRALRSPELDKRELVLYNEGMVSPTPRATSLD